MNNANFNINELKNINQKLETECINKAKSKIDTAKKRKYFRKDQYFIPDLAQKIADIAAKTLNMPIRATDIHLNSVPPHLKADLALRIPILMQKQKNHESSDNPITNYVKNILPVLAQELEINQKTLGIDKIEIIPPYINLTLNFAHFAWEILNQIENLTDNYGALDIHKEQTILVDFGSPNVAKTMHVGHLRSTIVGQVLCNIYKNCGYTVFGINHLGDWGTQFGKIAVAYEMWKDQYGEIETQDNPVQFLSKLYADFNQAAKENEELNEQARITFAKLEKGDHAILTYWKKFRDYSLKEFEKIYRKLNIKFDAAIGESFYEDKLPSIIQECLDKKIAQKDGQALVIDLSKLDERYTKIPTFLLVKSDGGTNYATRDIAAFYHRKKIFHPDLHIYVIGNEQQLHMRQIFATTTLLGYQNGQEGVHIGLGQIKRNGKKISSREGAGGLEDLLQEIIDNAEQNMEINKRDFTPAETKEIAEQIGIGALIYNDLQNGHEKDIEFDLDKILSMKGKSGPYLQYTYVRGQSLLSKAGKLQKLEKIDHTIVTEITAIEKALIRLLAKMPEVMEMSCEQHAPHHLALYLDELAQAFNKFHHDVHVVNSPEPLKEFRKHLVYGVMQTIKNGLNILNIPIPKRM